MRTSRRIAKKVGDRLGINWSKVSLSQFAKGMNVEKEHRNITKGNLVMTGRIALVHLKELPDYYTRLARMERER